jgi:hypothetical protein
MPVDSAFEIDRYSDLIRKIEVTEENNLKKYHIKDNGIEVNYSSLKLRSLLLIFCSTHEWSFIEPQRLAG